MLGKTFVSTCGKPQSSFEVLSKLQVSNSEGCVTCGFPAALLLFSKAFPLFCTDDFIDTCNNPVTSCLVIFAVPHFCSYNHHLWALQFPVCSLLPAKAFQPTPAPVLGSFFVHDWIQPQGYGKRGAGHWSSTGQCCWDSCRLRRTSFSPVTHC